MPLVKPSEFFDDKNKKSSLDSVKENLNSAAPEKLETISEAYDSFKTNLNQIQKLSNFTETLDNFKSGLERVDSLSDAVEQIKAEIQDFAKKEDLEESIMSQLFFIEESLKTTQSKIKTLNSKTLFNIKEEFDSLSSVVENFISTEVPLYKKLITESETRVDDRFAAYKESVALKVDDLSSQISKKFENIAKTLTGINEDSLDSIRENVSLVEDKVDFVLEKELPKYKKIFAETELKTEERLLETENKIKEQSENFEHLYLSKIESLREDFDKFVGTEIPKFKNTLVEFKLNAEDNTTQVLEKLDVNIETIKEGFDIFKKSVEDKNTEANEALEKNISSVENFINESKEEISSLAKTYENLYKDFKNREIHENKKLEEYSSKIEGFSQKISDLENSVSDQFVDIKEDFDSKSSDYYTTVKSRVEDFEKSILEKVSDIEINFIRNESHIQGIKESLQDTLSRIQLDVIEKNNKKITEKIEYLESILDTFNEKALLNEEGSLLTGTQATKTKDPLTPLDKNFVTFDDLSNHYRQFINRVQIQLASIGGGGAGFIKDLDDVSFDQTVGDNQLLIYNQANSKWVGIASTAVGGNIGIQSAGTLIKDSVRVLNFIGLGNTFSVNGDVVDISISAGAGGTWALTSAGIHTTKNVGIATTSAKAGVSLYVVGDAEIAGNISVAGTITYEDVTNVDSIGLITARSGIDVISGGINAVGVITATSFVGDLTGNVTGNADTATYSPNAGVATYSDVAGIATYASLAGVATYSDVSGISTSVVGGTASVTQLDVSGISTFNNDVLFNNNILHTGIATFGSSNGIGTVTVGLGSTALYVDGNARIVGVLTVGRASVTIDGDNNTITSGIVTITNSTIVLGDNISLSGSAAGINSAPNVLYVAKDGNDSNNGVSIDNAFLTISAAVGAASSGTIVKVLAGNYLENNPIEVPAFVSVVGDDLKTVTVSPNIATKDIFHVRKGCYIANMTFTNHIAPAAAVGFPTTEIATNVGGGKWESPYIQNCTSNTTTGTGLRIDGNQAEGLKSIVCDSYTQYNQGGVGVAITNNGYAQLVSVFTICCDVGISCHKGAQCSLTNSNTSFGTQGLVSDGVSDLQFSGSVDSSAAAAQDSVTVALTTTTRPYDGQVMFFGTLYYTVETITVTNGGSGYLTTPSVTIDSPDGPNGQTATAFATLNGNSVESITIISSGNQYSSAPTVTISAPDSGVTATATANVAPIYYTINSSTPVTAGITTLTLEQNLNNTIGAGSTAYFYQVSRISASSHTFEYVGSGNDITTATPLRGGVPIQDNEVVETNGGVVIYTSTDQSGNFRIGDGLQINQNTGTISGRAFTRSLFSEMTPFILALS